MPHITSCYHAYTLVLVQLTHPFHLISCLLPYVIFTYIHRHCLPGYTLFMHSLIVHISNIPFISLLALKGSLPIYTGLFPLMYLNLDLHQSIYQSIFHSLPSPLLLDAFSLELDRTTSLLPCWMRLCHCPLIVNKCQHLLTHCSHNSVSTLAVGSRSPGPLTRASSV